MHLRLKISPRIVNRKENTAKKKKGNKSKFEDTKQQAEEMGGNKKTRKEQNDHDKDEIDNDGENQKKREKTTAKAEKVDRTTMKHNQMRSMEKMKAARTTEMEVDRTTH